MHNDLDAGEEAPSAPEGESVAARVAFLIGGTGLFLAMATDAIAVLGRHTGFALLGSIEVVQACIVLIASSAMVFATLKGAHAAVHILTERLDLAMVARLARLSAVLSALVFLILAGGCLWLVADLWSGAERTELLHIPIVPLRLLQITALLFIAALFLRTLFRRGTR